MRSARRVGLRLPPAAAQIKLDQYYLNLNGNPGFPEIVKVDKVTHDYLKMGHSIIRVHIMDAQSAGKYMNDFDDVTPTAISFAQFTGNYILASDEKTREELAMRILGRI